MALTVWSVNTKIILKVESQKVFLFFKIKKSKYWQNLKKMLLLWNNNLNLLKTKTNQIVWWIQIFAWILLINNLSFSNKLSNKTHTCNKKLHKNFTKDGFKKTWFFCNNRKPNQIFHELRIHQKNLFFFNQVHLKSNKKFNVSLYYLNLKKLSPFVKLIAFGIWTQITNFTN